MAAPGNGVSSAPRLPAAVDRSFRWLLLALLAPAGMLTGHCLAYAVAVPDPDARSTMLMDTGHMWWALATPLAAILAVAGLLLAIGRRLPRRLGGRVMTPQACAWLAARLAVTQLAAFVGVEVVERVAVGEPLDHLVEHGILGHGAVAQLIVSVVLTAAVWWLSLTAHRLGGAIVRRWLPPDRELGTVVGPDFPRPRLWPVRPLGARAPPLIP